MAAKSFDVDDAVAHTDIDDDTPVGVLPDLEDARAHLLATTDPVEAACNVHTVTDLDPMTVGDLDDVEFCLNCLRRGHHNVFGGTTPDDVDIHVVLRGPSTTVKHRLDPDATEDDPEPACAAQPVTDRTWTALHPRATIFYRGCRHCFPGLTGDDDE
ncbi:hypothetical protein U3A55_12090 [Salarchaeum sp. III]|uniref:hypothetical protein n=1 Tax=Salarchaeum sp. III TaxID=3107927 RepID=UPI002EDB8E7B